MVVGVDRVVIAAGVPRCLRPQGVHPLRRHRAVPARHRGRAAPRQLRQRVEGGGVEIVRIGRVESALLRGPGGKPFAERSGPRRHRTPAPPRHRPPRASCPGPSVPAARRLPARRRLLRRRSAGPERVKLGHGDAPLRHGAIGVRLRRRFEGVRGLAIHHVMQQQQPDIEGRLPLGVQDVAKSTSPSVAGSRSFSMASREWAETGPMVSAIAPAAAVASNIVFGIVNIPSCYLLLTTMRFGPRDRMDILSMEASAVRFFKRNFLKSSEIDLGAAVFDVETRRLRDHSGQEIALRLRSREVLAVLMRQQGDIVGRKRAGGGRLGSEGRLGRQHRALHRRHTPGDFRTGTSGSSRPCHGRAIGWSCRPGHSATCPRTGEIRRSPEPSAGPRPTPGLRPSRSSGLTIWASRFRRHPVCRRAGRSDRLRTRAIS